MAIHRLKLNEFEELDYSIIAIHTALEDYRLAFFINQKLQLNLSKCSENIYIRTNEGESFFSKFTYFDNTNDIVWHLLENKNEIASNNNYQKANLFIDKNITISSQAYLLPEIKKADYFLKIEIEMDDYLSLSKTIAKLNTIEMITSAYSIDLKNIKTKNNLIF